MSHDLRWLWGSQGTRRLNWLRVPWRMGFRRLATPVVGAKGKGDPPMSGLYPDTSRLE